MEILLGGLSDYCDKIWATGEIWEYLIGENEAMWIAGGPEVEHLRRALRSAKLTDGLAAEPPVLDRINSRIDAPANDNPMFLVSGDIRPGDLLAAGFNSAWCGRIPSNYSVYTPDPHDPEKKLPLRTFRVHRNACRGKSVEGPKDKWAYICEKGLVPTFRNEVLSQATTETLNECLRYVAAQFHHNYVRLSEYERISMEMKVGGFPVMLVNLVMQKN